MRVNISRATSDEVPMTILSSYTKRAEILTVSVGVEQVNDGFSYTSVGIINDGGHLNISDVLRILAENEISVSVDELANMKEHFRIETREAFLNAMIRSKYSIDEELTLLRNRDEYPDEYEEYEYIVREFEEKIDSIGVFSAVSRQTHKVSSRMIIHDLRKLVESRVNELTDEQAAEVPSLYPTFEEMIGKQVLAGQRLWDDKKLYKVIQTHVASSEWYPAAAPSLYAQVVGYVQNEEGEVTVDECPEWVQVLVAGEGYVKGFEVMHNGHRWKSLYDGLNIWEPSEVIPTIWELIS